MTTIIESGTGELGGFVTASEGRHEASNRTRVGERNTESERDSLLVLISGCLTDDRSENSPVQCGLRPIMILVLGRDQRSIKHDTASTANTALTALTAHRRVSNPSQGARAAFSL